MKKNFKRGLALLLAVIMVATSAVYSSGTPLKATSEDTVGQEDLQAGSQAADEGTGETNVGTNDSDAGTQGTGETESTVTQEIVLDGQSDVGEQLNPNVQNVEGTPSESVEQEYNVVFHKPTVEGGSIKIWTDGSEKKDLTYDGEGKHTEKITEGALLNAEVTVNDKYTVDKVMDQNGNVIAPVAVNGNVLTYQIAVSENKEINVLYKEVSQDAAEQDNDGTIMNEESEKPARPGKALSETVNGTVITVEAPEGTLEEGWTLSVIEVPSESVKAAIEDVIEENKEIANLKAFDITIYDKNGNSIQPEGTVNVTFSNLDMDGEVSEVYHVDDSKKNAELVSPPVIGDAISFEAEHFSIYVTVSKGNIPVNTVESPYTMYVGDSIELTNDRTGSSKKWETDNTRSIKLTSKDKRTVKVEAKEVGKAVVTYTDSRNNVDSYYIDVKVKPVNVSFDLNNGTGTKPGVITGDPGAYVSLPSGEGVVRAGYVFLGWSDTKDSSGVSDGVKPVVYNAGGTYQLPNENITLYAAWAATSTTKGKITIAIRKDGVVPAEPAIIYGVNYYFLVNELSVSSLNEYFSPVHTTVGVENVRAVLKNKFYTAVDGYNNGNKYWNSTTQYVEWYVIKDQRNDNCWHIDGVVRDKSKVHLDYNPNSTDYVGLGPDGGEYAPGTKVTIKGQNTLARSGYDFIGWNTKPDNSGTSYAANSSIILTQDVTLYAQWAPKSGTQYTVQYYLQKTDNSYGNEPNDTDVRAATTGTTANSNTGAKSFTGYIYDENHAGNIKTGLVTGDGKLVLKRYYKVDTSQTVDVKYTVQHWTDGTHKASDDVTVTNKVWVNGAKELAVTADSLIQNNYTGYKFDGYAPATVKEGDRVADNTIIKVNYVKDADQTVKVKYTVQHWIEGTHQEADDVEVESSVWVNDAKELAVTADSLAQKTYDGYKFESYTPVNIKAGDKVADESVIKLNYVTDDDQKADVSYTVEHWVDGAHREQDDVKVTNKVWVNAKKELAVTADSLEKNAYAGYKFDSYDPSDIKAGDKVADKTTIRVNYVKDSSQTADVKYTVQHWVAGVHQTDDDMEVTDKVWVNAEKELVVTSDSLEKNTYVGYKFDSYMPTDIKAGNQVLDGSIIKMNYIKDEGQSEDVSYVVEHWIAGAHRVQDDTIVTRNIWVNDAKELAVTEQSIRPNVYEGYGFAGYDSSDVQSGTVVKSGTVIRLLYQANSYNLVIHYVDTTGATIAPDYTGRYLYQEQFTVQSPELTGYTMDYASISSGENGMPGANLEFTVTYTANQVIPVSPVIPVTPTTPTTPVTPVTPAAPTAPVTPATPAAVVPATPTVVIPPTQTPAGAIDAEITENEDGGYDLTPIEDTETPLANTNLDDHACCILHFLLMLLALLVLILYTKSMKKRQARIFERREELELKKAGNGLGEEA